MACALLGSSLISLSTAPNIQKLFQHQVYEIHKNLKISKSLQYDLELATEIKLRTNQDLKNVHWNNRDFS